LIVNPSPIRFTAAASENRGSFTFGYDRQRKLVPELRKMLKFTIYWFETDHIRAVILHISDAKNRSAVQILKTFVRDYILGRKVCFTKKFEI
jgi:hypothetical protein